MSSTKFPLYENEENFGYYLTGTQRFYIDTRYSAYSYLHHHNFAEISFYYEGSGTEMINGKSRKLVPGTVSVVLPHHIHSIKWDPDHSLRNFCCLFDVQLILGMHEDSGLSNMIYGIGTETPSFVQFNDAEIPRVMAVFEQLLQEYREPDRPGRVQFIRTKLTEALLLFVRKGMETSSNNTASSLKNTEHEANLLWPLLQFIHDNLDKELNLSEISKRFDLSVSYISRFFKNHMGIGFLKYLHRLRVERASHLLVHTNMTITEIAFYVGFDNSRTFSRVFRELKGISANEYRLRETKLALQNLL